jgi:hypothetical protein
MSAEQPNVVRHCSPAATRSVRAPKSFPSLEGMTA